ncbi:hypothetical protein P692DRAFT_20881705 [Suillus brevipes Sb2]|nr:hypothetical protein P692DRAFT_20881705 [Suillus brevipes Sb2]
MNQDNGSIRCDCHGRCVQMLPHPCFTIEQFLQAIYLVQSGQVGPMTSPQPIGWERNPDGADCLVHAFHCRCCIYAQRPHDTGSQEDLPATDANNRASESDDISHPETPQIRTYYEDSSDDEPSSPQGEGVPEENQWTAEEAPDSDVQEAPECEAD